MRLAGVAPEDITDIVISHAHWDHMGGIDLFPKATVWIQKAEYAYYTGDAWQPGGKHGGIDPEDVKALVQRNTEGRLRLVDGDDIEILPGIRAYTGARHTFASQYIRVAGTRPSSSRRTTAISTGISPSTRRAPRSPRPTGRPTSQTRSA